ncbi:complement C1q tumor necrosis factor-related protein 3-like [Argopecten irradians]|uniref:complement C1q tumor necrosis factor-related protein 3-like n=1 Tax=Argopecten irradians TaxID=31199 RepID=UPI0037216AC4
MMMIVTLFSAFAFVSVGLASLTSNIEEALTSAMDEVTIEPEKEYECLLYRLEDKLDRLEERMKTLEDQLDSDTSGEPSSTTGGLYAFSAHISETKINGRINGGLKFSSVDTNVGEAYNGNTGVFTSKADGVYVFNYQSVTGYYSKACHLTLVHNNETVVSSYAYSSYGYLTFGNSAVIKLNKEDVVHVAITGSSSCYLFGGVYTTFNGYSL